MIFAILSTCYGGWSPVSTHGAAAQHVDKMRDHSADRSLLTYAYAWNFLWPGTAANPRRRSPSQSRSSSYWWYWWVGMLFCNLLVAELSGRCGGQQLRRLFRCMCVNAACGSKLFIIGGLHPLPAVVVGLLSRLGRYLDLHRQLGIFTSLFLLSFVTAHDRDVEVRSSAEKPILIVALIISGRGRGRNAHENAYGHKLSMAAEYQARPLI